MEPIFQHEFLINDAAVDCFGRLKPSMLLFYCQEIAGQHCHILGADYDTLAQKNLFWAIIRQKVQITRLPRSGETIRVETWPMPTTKVCYPRSTVAYDADGQELFRAISMWVLMDTDSLIRFSAYPSYYLLCVRTKRKRADCWHIYSDGLW